MTRIKRKFWAVVRDGKISWRSPESVAAHMKKFPEGTDLEMTIEKRKEQRSLAQNRWYWGGILPLIAEETGNTVEELHEIFKRMFLEKRVVEYRGKSIAMPGSTPDQDSAQFTDYLERIRGEAASMGIVVPDPYGVEL